MYETIILSYGDDIPEDIIMSEEKKLDLMDSLESFRMEDGSNVLLIIYNNKLIRSFYDYGPPEDNSFYRDYHWITRELDRAYNYGLQENNTYKIRG